MRNQSVVSVLSFLIVFVAIRDCHLNAAEPEIEKTDLFVAREDGYARYHIPGIVVTESGTVLAWCEARKKGSDWADIRILLRRSTDEGKTWSKPVSIAEVSGP